MSSCSVCSTYGPTICRNLINTVGIVPPFVLDCQDEISSLYVAEVNQLPFSCPNVLPPSPAALTIFRQINPNTTTNYYIVFRIPGVRSIFNLNIDSNGYGQLTALSTPIIFASVYLNGIKWINRIFNEKILLTSPITMTIIFSTGGTAFVSGDKYVIKLSDGCNQQLNTVLVTFTRPFPTEFSSTINPATMNSTPMNSTPLLTNKISQDTCNNVRVPRITILGQRTVDNQYIADVQFTIFDEYTYYEEVPLPSTSRCSVNFIDSNDVKETIFKQCHIELERVVRGYGKTLFDKAVFLYNKYSESIGPSFYEFYDNLILYGLSKYILARVLYGKFNLKYLLQNYNEKFLANLGNSRFCGFLNAFDDCGSQIYNYNRFFKIENNL